jgi:Immunity protein Imm1
MRYVLDYGHENVDDPERPSVIGTADQLDDDFWRLGVMHGSAGLHVLAEIGPEGGKPELLFGFAVNGDDQGRAVIQWLPTGQFGWDPDVSQPDADVCFDGELIQSVGDIRTYPGSQSRVTPEVVQAAVREYVDRGIRPSNLHW